MSRFTVVGHSDKKPNTTPTSSTKAVAPKTDFLRNIVQSNIARAAAVKRTEPPTSTTNSQSASGTNTANTETKVSFDTKKSGPDFTTAPKPPQSSLKSALKRTSYVIPIDEEALAKSVDTSLATPVALKKSTKKATLDTTNSKSPIKTKAKSDKAQVEPTKEKPVGKKASMAMSGFFSAGVMPDFKEISKATKRKQPPQSAPNTKQTPQSESKRQKGNASATDIQPVKSQSKSTKASGFVSAASMADFDDEYDGSDGDGEDEMIKAMFGDDSDESEPEFGEEDSDDHRPTKKQTKSVKMASQTKVQIGKSAPKKAVVANEEEEMDGFISDDDDEFPTLTPTPVPQSKSAQKATTTKAGKSSVKQSDELELDGFLSEDSDDFVPRPGQADSQSESELDGFLSESDQDQVSEPKRNTKSVKAVQQPTKPQPQQPQQPRLLTKIPNIDKIPNNILPFMQADIESIPTTHSSIVTIYFPNESNPKKQTKDVKVDHYDLSTYQERLHSLLHYPYLNTLKDTFNYLLQSEIHDRFLWQYLPAPIVPRHNLIAPSSSLHNSSNHHLLLILNEEMIRHQQSHTLFNKFNKIFSALKDNTFNNFEQWIIRNLSVTPSLLPQALTSHKHRTILFNALRDKKVQMQSFVPPTTLDRFTLHTAASKALQSPRDKEQDILLGSLKMIEQDHELQTQLRMRGVSQEEYGIMLKKFQKHLKAGLGEIKNAQNQLSSKGCHQKDTMIKITEDINKNTMNQEVGVIYSHVSQFDKISITFHTGIGPIQLSLPHTVKLIILYISTMILNHCLDDTILTKMLNLSHNLEHVEFEDEFHHHSHDYSLLQALITTALPQLDANFSPSQSLPLSSTAPSSTDTDTDHDDDITIFEVDGEYFDQNGTLVDPITKKPAADSTIPSDQRQTSSQLTKQVAHILTRLQGKLPAQSILYQYIAMMLTGLVVVPKIPNLKQSTTHLSQFPQPLAQAIVTVLFRYDSLHGAQQYNNKSSSAGSGGGNQAAVPPKFLQQCGKLLNTNIEAFASPLNAYFSSYCSAFIDSDAPFGSLGSFFHFKPRSGSIFVNPPFAPDTILASIIHAEQLLAISEKQETSNEDSTQTLTNPLDQKLHTNTGLTFIFVFPYKPTELFTKWITTSPFCQLFTILPARQHIYTLGRQETNVNKKDFYRPARHDSILAILQNGTAKINNPVDSSIISKLLTHFMVHIPQRGLSMTPLLKNVQKEQSKRESLE